MVSEDFFYVIVSVILLRSSYLTSPRRGAGGEALSHDPFAAGQQRDELGGDGTTDVAGYCHAGDGCPYRNDRNGRILSANTFSLQPK